MIPNPKRCHDERGTSTSTRCGIGAKQLGKRMRKGCQCIPKRCANQAKLDAQSHQKQMPKLVAKKIMKIVKNHFF